MTGDAEESGTKRGGRGRGRGAGRGRARGRGRGRGRGRKAARVIESDDEVEEVTESQPELPTSEEQENTPPEPPPPQPSITDVADTVQTTTAIEDGSSQSNTALPDVLRDNSEDLDMIDDISKLEAPTFTTIQRGPLEPVLRLKWDHKASLMGEKVLYPMIHCCEKCNKPILIYGRMIPCKHVFCLACARYEPLKHCPRCNEKVCRVEQSGLGTVFMCTHGGSRYGTTGCRRTYLSQRDLQAHINHRHINQATIPDCNMKPINEPKSTLGSSRNLSENDTMNIRPSSRSVKHIHNWLNNLG